MKENKKKQYKTKTIGFGFVVLILLFVLLVDAIFFPSPTTTTITPPLWKKWCTQNKNGCEKDTKSYRWRNDNDRYDAIPYGVYSFENTRSKAAIVKALLPTKNGKASTLILNWPTMNKLEKFGERETNDCFPTKVGDCLGAPHTCPASMNIELPCYSTDSVHFAAAASVTLISTCLVGTILPKRKTGDLWAHDNSEDTYTYPHLRSKVLNDAMNVSRSTMRDVADLWSVGYLSEMTEGWFQSKSIETRPAYESFFLPPKYTFQQKHSKNVAAVMISNANAHSYRKEILKELMKHMNIASMGRLHNNYKFPGDKEKKKTGMVKAIVHKQEITSKYKFTFAMHNTIEYDRIDEKVWGPWLVGSVPIVLGPPNIEDYAPGDKSYISISDYKTPKEFVKHITYLSNNESAYNEYLAWKSEPPRPSFVSLFKYTRPWSCLMCKYHQSVMKGEDKEWLQEEKDEFSKIDASGMRISDAVGVVDDFRITTGVNKCSSTSGWHQDLWNELL